MTEASCLDQGWLAHELDLRTGRSIPFGRCEDVMALDRTGAFALVDGESLCAPNHGPTPPPLPGPPVSSRVVDMATGRTVLDLEATELWGGLFGPPREDGRPGIVVVQDAAEPGNRLHVRDLRTGADRGAFAPSRGALLKAVLTADGQRLSLTTTIGDLIVLDLDKLAHARRPDDAVIWTVKAHNGSVQGLAVSSGGLIATASSSGTVRVWSPRASSSPTSPSDPTTSRASPSPVGPTRSTTKTATTSSAGSHSTPRRRSDSLARSSHARSRPTSAAATSRTSTAPASEQGVLCPGRCPGSRHPGQMS